MNYIRLAKFSFTYNYYAYFDTTDFISERIFKDNFVDVKFFDTLSDPSEKYAIVMCKVNKKETHRFIKCMKYLRDKILILGNSDYEEYCNRFTDLVYSK
ncbi:MAG: hypothetical protein KBT03_01375 [Bacteroidales bacterium]|nr:hypothetical protein [Candidatus Scybalousia scybalohippi]